MASPKRLNPTEVKSRYLWILTELSNSLMADHPKPMTFSELRKCNHISQSRFYEVLMELENGGYIKRIEIKEKPYYILWKWGVLLLEASTMNAIGILEFMYDLEVK
jgi:DNA-binding HxlR family transcriptional regulator